MFLNSLLVDSKQEIGLYMYSPLPPTADAGGRGFRCFLWMWSVRQSLNAMTQSQNDRDSHKIISDTLIRRNAFNKWHFSFIWTLPLSNFILSFTVFGGMDNHSAKVMVCWWVEPVTPGRSRPNFTDSSSDSGQNGRFRPTPTPVSTPTPQPC